jgi:glycyl-tRNA synthetase
MDEERGRTITSMLKRRGIVRPAFEDYGGVTGLYDFGPVGGQILRRVQQAWREYWLGLGNIVEIDSPTITPYEVLEASGHVGAFNDHASECLGCGAIERTDHLLAEVIDNPDSITAQALDSALDEHNIACPACGERDWSASRPLDLMFSTSIGTFKGGRRAFMRPETAQGMFTGYPSLYRHFRERLPFGAIQVGKGYRNEISPRQGMIRLREFNMAELEYFIDPESTNKHDFGSLMESVNLIPDPCGPAPEPLEATITTALDSGIIRHPTVGWMMAHTAVFMKQIGIDAGRMRFRQHETDEMAHYASDCWDLELFGCHGWIECVGIAHRGSYDLEAHQKGTGSGEYRAWRQFDEPIQVDREVLAPIGAVIGPAFRGDAGAVNTALEELETLPDKLPFELTLMSGTTVQISNEMVDRRQIQQTIVGEWYTPHVVEPAFGLDRIIWHIFDHSFEMEQREGATYGKLALKELIAPYDCAIIPLHTKGQMVEMAKDLFQSVNRIIGVQAFLDSFGKSIGRRYARADEIGIPWAITLDQQSVDDNTATIRRRDDHAQIRVPIEVVLKCLEEKSIASLF